MVPMEEPDGDDNKVDKHNNNTGTNCDDDFQSEGAIAESSWLSLLVLVCLKELNIISWFSSVLNNPLIYSSNILRGMTVDYLSVNVKLRGNVWDGNFYLRELTHVDICYDRDKFQKNRMIMYWRIQQRSKGC